MNEVETYIYNLENKTQKALIKYFNNIILSFDNVNTKLNFKIPFYYYNKKWIIYINLIKPNGVEICFNNAFKFNDIHNILEAKKRKLVKGISFFDIEDDMIITKLIETIEASITYANKKRLIPKKY